MWNIQLSLAGNIKLEMCEQSLLLNIWPFHLLCCVSLCMNPVIPVSEGGSRPRYSAGLWWNSRGLKTQDLKTTFGKTCSSVFKGCTIQRCLSLGLEDHIWLVDKMTNSAKDVARRHHLTRGHCGESLHFDGFAFPGAAWTGLKLGSQLFYSSFTVFFCFPQTPLAIINNEWC